MPALPVHSAFLPAADQSILLVIDVQERLIPAMETATARRVLDNTIILIETAKILGVPIVVSEQYPRGLGATNPEILAALPAGVTAHEKLSFSCCAVPDLMQSLTTYGRRDVIVCGMETHVCVLQTVLDLITNGYIPYIAADAVCSRRDANRDLALDLMRQAGAVIGSTEIFAFGLVRAAGTAEFKAISRLVK